MLTRSSLLLLAFSLVFAIVQGDDNAFIQHDFVPINNTKDSEHRATSKIDPKIVALINKLSLDKDIDKKSENSTTVIPSGPGNETETGATHEPGVTTLEPTTDPNQPSGSTENSSTTELTTTTNTTTTITTTTENSTISSVESVEPLPTTTSTANTTSTMKPPMAPEPSTGSSSGAVALIMAVSFAITVIIVYFGLLAWRRYLEWRYGNRELLVNDLEFDTSDLRHFEL